MITNAYINDLYKTHKLKVEQNRYVSPIGSDMAFYTVQGLFVANQDIKRNFKVRLSENFVRRRLGRCEFKAIVNGMLPNGWKYESYIGPFREYTVEQKVEVYLKDTSG